MIPELEKGKRMKERGGDGKEMSCEGKGPIAAFAEKAVGRTGDNALSLQYRDKKWQQDF